MNEIERNMQEHLAEMSVVGYAPIAIIGIGCRFPGGANSPRAFWSLLQEGRDAITEVPQDRWNSRMFYDPDQNTPGKMNTRWGGFLDQIDQFDARFFGISPREATRMDPQHRLLLEVAWEAIEDAGLVPEHLGGTNTGVFIGIFNHDYSNIQYSVSDRHAINAYTNLGGSFSLAANRISYALNLRGPSMAIDTACSSSLTAVHVACQSIRNGETTVALAGGVNVLLKPEITIGYSKASMLSPEGRCRSFDMGANGYTRGEGAGIVVLKSLSMALRDHDSMYAVIRGSAINEDGRTDGIAVPSGVAQEEMLREAYRRANITPEWVYYVEAHGTGTPVGDSIEANSLGTVLSSNRPHGDDCVIGSVKTNIGHLESAAGIAGLIKVALALKHHQIPPSLHCSTPNPKIPFEKLRLRVPQTLEPWPTTGHRPRFAGVNAFGFGGANAHIVVEEAPQVPDTGSRDDGSIDDRAHLLPLSARSPEALQALVKSYLDMLTTQENGAHVSLSDICYSASVRRGHHDYRLALIVHSKEELAEHLSAFLTGETRPYLSSGRSIPGRVPKLAFVFSGMGPQWWAMGRQLLEEEPVFREVIEQWDERLGQYADWSLLEELTADESHSRMRSTQIAQPANCAIQVALAAVWRSWGIEPDTVVGHSVGEVAACYVAGALSLDDAVQVIFHRSRLQHRLAGHGTMLAVGLSAEKVERFMRGYEECVSIAAINSPLAVTLAGDTNALQAIAQVIESEGIFSRFLMVEVPYHSPKMELLQTELLDSLRTMTPQPTTIPLFSTVTGQVIEGTPCDATYWWRNVRQPVRFATAIDALIHKGYTLFLEISPHPVLATSIRECLAAVKEEGTILHSLRRQEPERAVMLGSLGTLYTSGYPIDWYRLYPCGGNFVRFPLYPWQRERYWQESEASKKERLEPSGAFIQTILGHPVHPLLGSKLTSAQGDSIWTGVIETQRLPYLNDHRLHSMVVYPGVAYVEMALAAAREKFGEGPCRIENLEFQKALFLRNGELLTLQLILDQYHTTFDIYSRISDAASPWTRHVTGNLCRHGQNRTSPQVVLDEIRSRCPHEISKDDCYRRIKATGLDLGPCFQRISRFWYGDGELLYQIDAHEALEKESEEYFFHPTILDACLHGLIAGVAPETTYLPVYIDRLWVYCRPRRYLWSHVRLVERGVSTFTGDVQLLDGEGNVVADVQGLRFRALEGAQVVGPEDMNHLLYDYRWELKARPGQSFVRPPAEYLPSPLHIAEVVRSEATRLCEQLGRIEYYTTIEPRLNGLSTAYIINAFKQLGWMPCARQRIALQVLSEQLGIVSQHRRLLERLFEMLYEEGILSPVDDQWEVVMIPKVDDPQETWKALLSQCPAYHAELVMLRRCGEHLAEILRGDIDPLQCIFPEESLTISEHFYQDAPAYRMYNMLVQRAVMTALERVPEGHTVRILEVGGGTGGTTSYLLPLLPNDRTEYVFTDVSPIVITQAEQKFREYPFVRYRQLNIEVDPVSQGFDAYSFDLILAADVLHTTCDLRQTLGNVKKLFTSNGLLVLLEGTTPTGWVDMIFGLLKEWWLFTDGQIRPSHPLISWTKWQELLTDVGFTEVTGMSDVEAPAASLRTVILAQAPPVWQDTLSSGDVAIPQAHEPGCWLIFANSSTGTAGGIGQHLAMRFREHGAVSILVSHGVEYHQLNATHFQIRPEQPDDMRRLLETVMADQSVCRGIVHLWNLDAPSPESMTASSLESFQTVGCLSVVYLIQALATVGWSRPPRLYLVTCGTQAVGSGTQSFSIAQSPVWGLGRAIGNEHPELRCKRVDLSRVSTPEEVRSLWDELWTDDREDEVVLRGTARYVSRVMPCSLTDRQQMQPRIFRNGSRSFQLEIATPGLIDTLSLQTAPRQQPGPGEVEIQIVATGLNFKDIAKATNLLADTSMEGTFSGRTFGLECTGTVTALGEGVEEVRVGETVMALAPRTFSRYTTTDARLVVSKPAYLSFEEAATIPVVFLTAYYSLCHLGKISSRDRVLIHAAAGGVGLAAVQLAQRVGADIFATAGSPEKREFLQALGVQHVMDSRSFAFVDEVMAHTNGVGVDIVLNSLAGEAIPQSLSVLGAYGRFIELGKRDIDQNSKLGLGLRPFHNNLSFFTVDLDRMMRERPDLIRILSLEILQGFTDGTLRPLPYRVFPISNVKSAFRYMAQARHIGKVIVSVQDQKVVVAPAMEKTVTFRDDGTYLITGGVSGFGLATAQWMVVHGARHLVLVGRRGASSSTAQAAVQTMQAAGAKIMIARTDVTQEQQVADLFAHIEQSMPPLRGILHGAMVLDDEIVLHLDRERFQKVMAPKAIGAWNLHIQSLSTPLDFFVLFSSITSIIGNPGQGNYLAANVFLDVLAHHRRAQGLPALSLNWGVVSDVGHVARNPDVAEHLYRIGLQPLPSQLALKILGTLLQQDVTQVGVASVDWSKWCQMHAMGGSPRFMYLAGEGATDHSYVGYRTTEKTIRDTLKTVVPEERCRFMEMHLCEQVARILGTSSSKVDVNIPLTDLGLDSLMTVELMVSLESSLGLTLPVMLLWQYPTVSDFASYLASRMSLSVTFGTGAGRDEGMETADRATSRSLREPDSGQAEGSAQHQFPVREDDRIPCQEDRSWTLAPLVVIQPHGTQHPLFCVTAGYGDLFAFAELARHLGEDQPFFQLQPPQRKGRAIYTHVRDLIACYVRELRAIQPEGPYRLGGYSIGGLAVFEIAQQLHAQGQRVELLILLDAPFKLSATGYAFYHGLQRIVSKLFPHVKHTGSRTLRILQAFFRDEGLVLHMQVLKDYVPQSYAGRVILLRPRWSLLRLTGTCHRWRDVAAGGLDDHILPGDHDSFIRPHIQIVAQHVRAYLDELKHKS